MTCKSDLTAEEQAIIDRLRLDYERSGRAAADQRRAAREALARLAPGEFFRRREELLQHIETGRRDHERNAFVDRIKAIGDVRGLNRAAFEAAKRRAGL